MRIIKQGNLTVVKGIKASGIHCGIKSGRKKDLALVYSESPATAAGVFTSNCITAAPISVSKENLLDHQAQAVIINSGIANSATGEKGIEDSRQMAFLTASALNIPASSVIVASTGLIGHFLPMDKIASGIDKAVSSLSTKGGKEAAQAIMTTDTFTKEIAVRFEIAGFPVILAGMAKGAGMIRPNMATMLAFLVTDAAIQGNFLQEVLRNAVEKTFNRITVDGDTSTNDMVVMLANGLSGIEEIAPQSKDIDTFTEALDFVCEKLSLMIVKDGEGATKLVSINVTGALTETEAGKIAFRIAESPLVKTSLYGRSCNWGRVMAAAGSAGVSIDPGKIGIFYGPVQVVRKGLGLGSDSEKAAESHLKSKEVSISVDLHVGKASITIRTTDLSPEYIHINADYIS